MSTIDRSKIEAMVRAAVAKQAGGGKGEVESSGGLLISPDRGVNLGEPYDPRVMPALLAATPARIVVGRAGTRYRTNTMLRFRADHAAAKDAVMSEVDGALIAKLGMFEVATRAPDKATFLQRPDLGRALSDEARAELGKRVARAPRVILIYGDGLSAAAINQHLPEFHGALVAALATRGITHAPAFFVRRSRVKVMDEIARLTGAEAAVFVCGERPGLGFADSLSAYFIYQPAAGATDADREVISNINPRGRPPTEAARDVAASIERVLREKKSGVVLSS
jgi:ethanolamine ammonia-lyase small subunit